MIISLQENFWLTITNSLWAIYLKSWNYPNGGLNILLQGVSNHTIFGNIIGNYLVLSGTSSNKWGVVWD